MKYFLPAVMAAAFLAVSQADTIPLNLAGDYTSVDLWGGGSLGVGANPGYPGFPGTSAWPAPIASPDGLDNDAFLRKVSNGSGGGPFPSGSGIYYGGFGTAPNTNGGTLGVVDDTPVIDLQTVTFQIQIGQAYGYDLLNNDLSLVKLYYTTSEGTSSLSADYGSLLNRFYNGSVSMPTGEGGAYQPEDIYVNLWGLQWDLSGISGITSFEIRFTGVEHASLTQLQLDQSSDAYASSAFPQDGVWLSGGEDANWSTAGNWQAGNAPAAGQNVTLSGGTGVVVDADQTVGILTLNAQDGFEINSSDNSVLQVVYGINGTAENASSYTLHAPLRLEEYNLIDLNANSALTIAGPVTGSGFYKQGEGSLFLTGDNVFDGDDVQLAANGLIIRGGTNYISGTNELTGSNLIGFNIRQDTTVVLHGGDNRLDSRFVVNLLAATSKLVLGDEVAKSDLTVSGLAGSLGESLVTGSRIVGGSLDTSTLTVDVASGTWEFGGNLGGEGTLANNLAFTKKGAGTQILSGTSTHSGPTRIEGGLLLIGSSTALSAGSNVQLDGGILGFGAGNYSANLGTGAGEIQFLGDGGFAARGASRTVTLNGGAGLTWGEGGFVGNGNKLLLSHSAADNTVDFTNAIDLGARTRTVRVDNGSANVDARLSGVLSGSGGLNKTGTGTLELTAANTYAGGTTVREGSLVLTGADGSVKGDVAVGAGASLQLLNTAAANHTDRLEDTAKVTLSGGILSFSNPTSGSTPAYSEAFGELVLGSGGNVVSTSRAAAGNTSTLTVGALTRQTGATVNFSGASVGADTRNRIFFAAAPALDDGIIGGWATAGNDFATYGENGVTAFSAYATSGESAWAASDNVFLAGANFSAPNVTLTEDRAINALKIQGATGGSVGNVVDLAGRVLAVESGGILTYGGASSRTTKINNGVLTAGAGGDAELIVTANGLTDIGASIADNGAGKVSLVKAGSSTLTLTGDNTYTGGTVVNQGSLTVAGHNTGGGDLKVAKNATMTINAGGSFLASGVVEVDGTLAGSGELTFDGSVMLTGSGVVNHAITVGGGEGQVNVLSPGNSPGAMTFGANQTWAEGGVYVWELAGTNGGAGVGWDFVSIAGSLDITAPVSFTLQIVSLDALHQDGLVFDFDSASSYSWKIASAANGITGFDAGLFDLDLSGFGNAYDGSWSISQTGNDIYLNYAAVPEPSAGILLILGLSVFARRSAALHKRSRVRSAV